MRMAKFCDYFQAPIGLVQVTATDDAVVSVRLVQQAGQWKRPNDVTRQMIQELSEYFDGVRENFDVKLHISGTPFREKVWQALRGIPFGETVNYKDVGEDIESPNAMRAVGSACGKNNLWIVVPCHRVVAADGSLGGYAGGLRQKEWLLAHEKKCSTVEKSKESV